MGVKGLMHYIDHDTSEVRRKISIPEMAAAYSAKDRPVLVVDGMSLIHKLYHKEDDWVYGGQWTEFVESFKTFVSKFHQFGIDLIFFYDGSVCKSKRTEWVNRRLKRLSETDGLFYYIKSTNQHPPESMFQLPTSMGSLTRFILKYECHCQIRTTILEADQEISEYANRNPNCFAILSQDSDFIIYDTKPYLSVTHLNMDDLTTVMYDRYQLAREIGLNFSLFPLFSCLLGNDIIQAERLRPFHKSLCRSRHRNPSITELIPRVVELIRMNRWTGQEIGDIAMTMNIDRDSLIRGLDVYSSSVNNRFIDTFRPKDPLAIAREMVVNGEGPCVIYTLMCKQEYESSEVLENRSYKTIKPTAIIYREIRKRLYAVLFESENVTVKEWCAYHGNPMERPEYITPGKLDYQGPKLTMDKLWSNQPQYSDHQWELFRSCYGISIPSEELQKIPKQFLSLCCILNFLILRQELTGIVMWEVVAFVCQAISPYARNANEIRNINVNGVDARAVQLAGVFMRGVSHVDLIVTVCIKFFPHYYLMPWHFFDGKLFHYYYLMAKRGSTIEKMCENQESVFKQLHMLYHVITAGTLFPRTLPASFLPN